MSHDGGRWQAVWGLRCSTADEGRRLLGDNKAWSCFIDDATARMAGFASDEAAARTAFFVVSREAAVVV